MAQIEHMTRVDLWGRSPIDLAVARLQEFEPPEGYYLAFSGGKRFALPQGAGGHGRRQVRRAL